MSAQTEGLLIFLFFIIIVIIAYYQAKVSKLNKQMEELKNSFYQQANQYAQQQFDQWVKQYSQRLREQIEENVRKNYELKFKEWKEQEEERIREDAKTRSFYVNVGKIGEQLAPLILAKKYDINLKDFKYVGGFSPVDFIAFRGLTDGKQNVEIIFFEIKTGKTTALNDNEKKLRDAILDKRVRYEVVNLNDLVNEVISDKK